MIRVQNARVRGHMPLRIVHKKTMTETINQQGRTGESSLALSRSEQIRANYYKTRARHDLFTYPGYGMAEGSYTEKIRESLYAWMKNREPDKTWGFNPVTFKYRLYRHKIITVNFKIGTIIHDPNFGHGKKGFYMTGIVLSIDGIAPDKYIYGQSIFFLNRIISGEYIGLLLAIGDSK